MPPDIASLPSTDKPMKQVVVWFYFTSEITL